MTRRSLVGLLLLAGCNSLLGVHDPERGDSPVTGRWIDDHITTAGTVQAAMDLSRWDIAAYVADPTQPTGYRVVPAAVTGPGAFGFASLPASYLVRIQSRSQPPPPYSTTAPEFFQATSRTIDLGEERVGRPDVQPETLGGSLAFDITGPTPFWSTDSIMLYSVDAGTLILPQSTDALVPHKGFRGHVVWFGFGQSGVLANDDLWAIHLRGNPFGSAPMQILEAATFAGVSASDGAPGAVPGGMFTPSPVPSLLPVLAGGDYRAALGLGGPPGPLDSLGLAIYASPGHGVDPRSDNPYALPLLTVPGPPVVPGALISPGTPLTIDPVNPFPADWEPVAIDTYSVLRRRVVVPGTIGSIALEDQVISVRPVGKTLELAPLIASPRNLQIDGAAGEQVIAPHAAVVRWDPVPGANYYRLSVRGIERMAMTVQTWFVPVATLYTTDASITVPGDLLLDGHRYLFQVWAVVDEAGYADGKLRRTSRPHGEASAHSGIVLVSTTCGNGKLDPGEECDAGGASATCDFDCTAPLCGDGIVNPAAGEACDSSNEPVCGFDCKGPPVCGNGQVEGAEQCDDGNTVDGDGCSHTCQVENLCGNGRVDPGEQCDDGNRINTDGCRNNCQRPSCGDGVLDTGEQCDDGNQVRGDGCDGNCQVEPPPS